MRAATSKHAPPVEPANGRAKAGAGGRPAGPRPRIGIHTSIAGGVERAADRARALGCECLQIFSASPRQWRAITPSAAACAELTARRRQYGLEPLAIHVNYLVNLASAEASLRQRSQAAFRGELERAAALKADFLILHPGSMGAEDASAGSGETGPGAPPRDREAARVRLAAAIRETAAGFAWGRLRLLIENTAGGGGRLGGDFRELAAILDLLRGLPAGACLDTCHCWVAGYDLVSEAGYRETCRHIERELGRERVFVWHANDTRSRLGSRLDRHEHIGAGNLGPGLFRRMLHDARWKQAAFILETPLEKDGDDRRNLQTLLRLRDA